MAYAVLQDVYDLGLTAQAFVVRPRGLDVRAGDSLDFATGTFRLLAHGLTAADAVELVLIGAGALPDGAVVNTPYYPLPLDFFRFRLSESEGGPALTFNDAGSGAWAIQLDPERRLQRHLHEAAARIDECLTAENPPLQLDPVTGLYPELIIGLNARMAARAAIPTLQFENAAFRTAADRLLALEGDTANPAPGTDRWHLAQFMRGKPVNVRPTDETPGVAEIAPRARSSRRSHGWDRRTI